MRKEAPIYIFLNMRTENNLLPILFQPFVCVNSSDSGYLTTTSFHSMRLDKGWRTNILSVHSIPFHTSPGVLTQPPYLALLILSLGKLLVSTDYYYHHHHHHHHHHHYFHYFNGSLLYMIIMFLMPSST